MKNGFDWESHSRGLINLYGFIRCLCVRTLLWWASGRQCCQHNISLGDPRISCWETEPAPTWNNRTNKYSATYTSEGEPTRRILPNMILFKPWSKISLLHGVLKVFAQFEKLLKNLTVLLLGLMLVQDLKIDFLDELYKWNKPKTCEVKCEISTVL